MDTTESPHPCACSLGRSQRKRGADLLDLAFSATAYFFPPVASLPPDFNNAVMYISVPSFQGRKSQGTHVFLVMHCGGLLPRRARGTLSSHRRQDKGGSCQMKVACGFSESEEFCPFEKQIRQKPEPLFTA